MVDTAPVNEVVPGTVDFDANTSSGGYADLVVTLNMVDGAKLKNIRSNGKTLEENWQYKIAGSKVTINKSAVAEFGKSGASYADFVFVMSKGQSPTLRVNYVTTYALTASVVDDLGLPISGASVTFTPSDAESGTAAQTLTTGSDGTATVYVKRGSYVVTATHSRFTAAVTQTVKISAGRTVKLTGEILENVQLVVTNAYGAPLSGAVVTVGGKSITTGTDGTASFSLKRGSYVAQVACTGYFRTERTAFRNRIRFVSAYSFRAISPIASRPKTGRLFVRFYRRMGIGRKGVKTKSTAACGWGAIGDKGGLLTGDGLVRSECSVIMAGYNTERRCQTDTLVLAIGKGRCRSRGGIRLHLLIQLDRQSAEIHARDSAWDNRKKAKYQVPERLSVQLSPSKSPAPTNCPVLSINRTFRCRLPSEPIQRVLPV